MKRTNTTTALRLDFEQGTPGLSAGFRKGLRLAPGPGRLVGPDKYRELDLRRRRAQIRARRVLGLA